MDSYFFQVLFNMALTHPLPLADHTEHLETTAVNFPKTTLLCIQVMSAIAKSRQDKASTTVDFVLSSGLLFIFLLKLLLITSLYVFENQLKSSMKEFPLI